ncbi:MAG: SNF2-related protein [Planctomycetia bacterium]|nr:SNF2-related protein [Planctomycetia bacterium]
MIADDVGLGKTISAGMILSELVARKHVQRTMIVAPRILCHQWVTELRIHFGLTAVEAKNGRDFLQLKNNPSVLIVVVTYESIRDRLSDVSGDDFQLCIFDEAHKLRNLYGTNAPPKIAENVKKALEKRIFRFVLMLTATPIQNRIWDLYSLMDLIKISESEDNPFGSPEDFKYHYLKDPQGFHLKEKMEKPFRVELQKILCRTRRNDANLSFPCRELRDQAFILPELEYKLLELLQQIIIQEEIGYFQQVSLARAILSSPHAFLKELRNASEKQDYLQSYLPKVKSLVDSIQITEKMKIILEFLKELKTVAEKVSQPWRAVIFTIRIETQEKIGEWLRQNGFSCGFIRGGNVTGNKWSIERYSMNPPECNILVSTDSGSEGLNLQAGNVIINYDLPWNPMIVEQRIGRVQRLGSSFKHVTVFNAYAANTIEGKVVNRLLCKLIGITQAIGEVESILGYCNFDDKTLDRKISDLVLHSLKKQDVQKSQEQMEASIERGFEEYQKNLKEIERRIPETRWDKILSPKNAPPKLTPQKHRMSEKEFFLNAMSRCESKVWNDQRKIHFIMENKELLNDPDALRNSTLFEQQISNWRKRASSLIYDLPQPPDEHIQEVIKKQWKSMFPDAQMLKVQFHDQPEVMFQGKAYIKADANNALDRFQKVFSVDVSEIPGKLPEFSEIYASDHSRQNRKAAHAAKFFPQYDKFLETSLKQDEDLEKFQAFYTKRANEKLASTQDTRLQKRIQKDYEIDITSEICGLKGYNYNVLSLTIQFQMDGHTYSFPVRFVPVASYLLPFEISTCAETHYKVPEMLLSECEYTHKKVLPHCLVKLLDGRHVLKSQTLSCYICGKLGLKREMVFSSISQQYGHTSHLITCSYSGKKGFPDEMMVSDFSGKMAFSQFLSESPKSHRKGILNEFVTSNATGAKLLPFPDEAIRRELDGKWYESELFCSSALSGRMELASEMLPCELTGDMVLVDELEECCISKLKIRKDRLYQSPYSKKYFNPDLGLKTLNGELLPPNEICGICQLLIHPKEESLVYSMNKRICHAKHFVVSVQTQKRILKESAAMSDYSHQYAEKEFLEISPLSGRKGFSNEMILCEATHEKILCDEAVFSKRDKKWYRKDLCIQSATSNLWGLRKDAIECKVTKKLLFPEDMGMCCILRKRVSQSLLVMNPISGKQFCKHLVLRPPYKLWQCLRRGGRPRPPKKALAFS